MLSFACVLKLEREIDVAALIFGNSTCVCDNCSDSELIMKGLMAAAVNDTCSGE
jgi:hypothetical protein